MEKRCFKTEKKTRSKTQKNAFLLKKKRFFKHTKNKKKTHFKLKNLKKIIFIDRVFIFQILIEYLFYKFNN